MANPLVASQGFVSLLGELGRLRGGWFLAGWLITAVDAVMLLATVGHGMFLNMDKGSH